MTLLRHRYLRRFVTVPTVFVVFFLLVTTLPLWFLVAAFASPWLPGRLRPLRLLWLALVYLALQVAGLVVSGFLWVASGFGRQFGDERMDDRHYRLLRRLLAVLVRTANRTLNLRTEIEADPPPDEQPQVPHDEPRPLLVLSRHAGPGDSFLLVHEILSTYGRRPRIVLKATLQWDPLIDVVLNRLPNRFIIAGRAGVADTIGALARDVGPADAVVIFPEGANFTPDRRRRGIERMEREGRHAHAQRARDLRHLLSPRPGGTLAALASAPHADIVFVAHSGLEHLSSVRDLWRGLPMDAEVRARLWTVASEDVPRGRDEQVEWLLCWWERLDGWIDSVRTG